jgi:Xaa-Pro aminopeptidase
MDLGAAYNGYSGDITRTIPVNGKFTKEQKDIYEAVLRTQKEAIKLFKTGTLPALIEEKVANMLRDELFNLGLVTDKNASWQYRLWYPHGCSHSIGLDVHDATPASYYKEGLKPGMIFTIEPGLYISEQKFEQVKSMTYLKLKENELKDFIDKVGPIVKRYNNIGVRIEDDVLITKDGNKVISEKCPKEVADIEKIMKQKSRFAD